MPELALQYNSKKTDLMLNFFWGGFIIYILGYALSATNKGIIQLYPIFQLLGLVSMFGTAPGLIKFQFDSKYLRVVYILYILWLFFMIFKGLSYFLDYTYIRIFFFSPQDGMLYFAPLILLLPRNFIFYKRMFDVIIILGLCFIIFDVVFIGDLLNSDNSNTSGQTIIETFSNLSFSCGFILLTYHYHSKKRQMVALGTVMLAFLLSMIRARRGLLLMYSEIIFFSYLLFILRSRMRILVIYLTIFSALAGALYVSSVYRPQNNKLYGYLLNRGDEDTRSDVEIYFHDDMKTKDWIFGRGIKGEYFAPNIEEDLPTNYRSNIETGYEQTILKGGLISLGLFFLIAIPASINGIFFSKNTLSKVAGIWIFMSIINSYPSTVNAFTLQYLLVWISIGICYSRVIRKMPEEKIKEIFQSL